MDPFADVIPAPVVDRLLEGVEYEVGPERGGDAPPDDAAREDVDDERDVDEALPRDKVREMSDLQLIRAAGAKLPIAPGAPVP